LLELHHRVLRSLLGLCLLGLCHVQLQQLRSRLSGQAEQQKMAAAVQANQLKQQLAAQKARTPT